jgi:uncharacterized protein (DUF302 family)
MSQESGAANELGIVTKTARGSVDEAVAKLTGLIESHGLHLFAVVDHSAAAHEVGLSLRYTKVVFFGSPKAGTPVMEATPLAALDLPLKVLIWDDDGTTRVSYTDPDALAARYNLAPELADNLRGIGPLTDALVAK